MGACVKAVLRLVAVPTIFLGGGGYNLANSARYWTALICGREISIEIPDHEYILEYGPAHELTVSPKNLPDLRML